MQANIINTERFILRVLTPELVGPTYLSWFSDDATKEFINYSKSTVTIESLKSYVEEKLNSSSAIFYGIFDKESSKHLGNIKFEPVNFVNKSAVLGILIGETAWRSRGVFGEILKYLEFELINLGINSLLLGVDNNNLAAIKAYQKNGFKVDEKNELEIDSTKYISMKKKLEESVVK